MAGVDSAPTDPTMEDRRTALPAGPTIAEGASFGIEEGEVDNLERKWISWCAHRPSLVAAPLLLPSTIG
jgi:hypothetical protein